jgi:hypothetical protein
MINSFIDLSHYCTYRSVYIGSFYMSGDVFVTLQESIFTLLNRYQGVKKYLLFFL